MNGLGKRSMERFDLDIPVCLTLGEPDSVPDSSKMSYRIKNICSGGAYFFTDNPLRIGTKVEIDLQLDLKKYNIKKLAHSEVQVSGSIIRTDSNGMAVKFDKNFKMSPVLGHA